ncbi:MAG: SGNH/GDSL hydrolase family protein [Arenibacterium sp.]
MRLSGPLAYGLLPVLAAQALYVIARAERLPEAEGPRVGALGSGPALRLLILGDSSAAGVGVSTQDHALAGQVTRHLATRRRVSWRLVARSGITTTGAVKMMREVPADSFDIAITALGVNDATRFRAPEAFHADQHALGELLRAQFGVKQIVRSAVPPLGQFRFLPQPLRGEIGACAGALDQVLRNLCKEEPDAHHLPFDAPLTPEMMARDGFHPGAPIYAEWGKRLADLILSETGSAKAQ